MSTVSPRADFVASLVWIAFGAAVVAGSLAMERMERFGAKVYTAPGLVPGLLGALIALLGLLLLVRSVRRGARMGASAPTLPAGDRREGFVRAGTGVALTLVYTVALVGRGLPFWLVTAAFVFAFLLVFDLPERRARGQAARGLVLAAVIAVATSAVVTFLFERVFLVRMP